MSDHILIRGSSENMQGIQDESVHLVITSPPYNCGIDYHEYKDRQSWSNYIETMRSIFKEIFRVLKNNGRVCINVANLDRYNEKKGTFYKPLDYLFWSILTEIGFVQRGVHIWYKGSAANITTAWGSYQSSSNPSIRDTHEMVLVFSKFAGSLDSNGSVSDLTKEEFHEFTKSVWTIPAKSNKKHPAVFPAELVRRCMKLYSFPGQMILDPFAGSGTVAKAAKKINRCSISFELVPRFQELILQEINQTQIIDWFQSKEVRST